MERKAKAPKQIFLLFACDEWKDNGSMRLVCATTSPTRMKMAIAAEIKDGNMEYNNGTEDNASSGKQEKAFKADWKQLTRDQINSRLTYGFYDYVYDGERN